MKAYPFKVFRNKEGSHIVGVHRYYSGTIDGKRMSSYSTGSVNTDVFKEGFILPSPVPDCRGFDFNRENMEGCAGSTVNRGSGRLSHDQLLFATRGKQSLSMELSLHYRSKAFAPSFIGGGWSHSYEMSLRTGPGTTKVFWDRGVRRVYTLYNGGYVPPRGDYSSLAKKADGSWTLTEKNGLQYHFDPDGVVKSLIDRNGNTVTFIYDGGRLIAVTDPNGRGLHLTYDDGGKLTAIIDPQDNVYLLHYVDGRLSNVIHPDAGQWNYSYDANGLLAAKTDPVNNLVTYAYDTEKRLSGTIDAVGKTRAFSYPAAGTPGKIPDPYPVQALPKKNFTTTEKDGNIWTEVVPKIRTV